MDVFLYGTLRHLPLLRVVLGDAPRAQAARLPGYSVHWADGQSFPIIAPDPDGVAEGLLLSGLDADAVARLDHYEAGFDYALHPVEVEVEGHRRPAQVYFARDDRWAVGAPWSLADWEDQWAELTVLAAREYMDAMGREPLAVTAARYPQMLMRAATTLRARATSKPRRPDSGLTAEKVSVSARRRPYANYFTVEEFDLRFPRFSGGESPTVTRAAFVGGDAVTVLPYDPVRDRVLVIEQFRFAPFVRGDRFPWVLEPVAGRIDPGETPEDAVHRELAEEAGIALRALHHVADYYPSPGAWTEFLYTFVGIADLPDEAAGVAGVDHEAEDIRSHILAFDEAMEMVRSGAAETGPLILTLLWLEPRRAALAANA